MTKNRTGNYFEDFRVGAKIRHATPRTLTEGDRSVYIGLTGSRASLASAETSAQQIGFARRPLEDLLVFNTAFGKTVPDISLNAVANLGYADVRFVAPVYCGDTLAVESEVIGLKENSNRKSGVVYVRSTATNQHRHVVLTWIRWVMVHKRDANAPCGEPVLPAPDLLGPVPVAYLDFGVYEACGAGAREIVASTGCADLWDDYEAGERIDHPGAMTVNDSDHSIATRLYQNTAKAHFDGFAMANSANGRRLVYGGHVMSICRALSYDGLENGLSIVAINGGSHVNPTAAGDTLFCATQVIERIDTGLAHVAGLRLRLIGAKNLAGGAAAIEFTPATTGKPLHAPEVVLDLDYTLAIPRRQH